MKHCCGISILLIAACMFTSGCVGVGHAIKTGYYAHKGAESFFREIEYVDNPPVLPETYRHLAVLPITHKLGELAEWKEFKQQMDNPQQTVYLFLKEGWPVPVSKAADLDSIKNKKDTLAIRIHLVDYNRGGAHLKTGIGEWHTMIARASLLDARTQKVVGIANLEGRVRVKGMPIDGIAHAADVWLQKIAAPDLREEVRKRHEEAKE
jgi:hypothetical protein